MSRGNIILKTYKCKCAGDDNSLEDENILVKLRMRTHHNGSLHSSVLGVSVFGGFFIVFGGGGSGGCVCV